jgi:hypothetical protein
MFKSLKQGKDMALRIVLVMKVFWSFGFVSFGIVSNFVLRYSDFSPAKENDYVSPLPGALLKPPVLPVVADWQTHGGLDRRALVPLVFNRLLK